MLLAIGYLIGGLVILTVGAELLVRGASRLATAFGVSALVVGLTVVAFGTSAPEVAVSVGSSLKGTADIAVGNVIGSNIFNILFILGLSALVAPLTVDIKLIRRDVPLMVGLTMGVYALALNNVISQFESALLLILLAGYIVFTIRESRKESAALAKDALEHVEGAVDPALERQPARVAKNLGLIVVGLGGLALGSNIFVDGAVTIARSLGWSDLIIGLTIVSAGTSLPEVATSVVASLRGERDIAVGNVVGSNIFNLTAVLGAAGVVVSQGLPVSQASLEFDFLVMLAASIACLPIFFTGFRIDRWEGALFMLFYVAFVVHVVLSATSSAWLPDFQHAMLYYMAPLTVVTLLVIGVREWKKYHVPQTTVSGS